jgi:hypothetical protein
VDLILVGLIAYLIGRESGKRFRERVSPGVYVTSRKLSGDPVFVQDVAKATQDSYGRRSG